MTPRVTSASCSCAFNSLFAFGLVGVVVVVVVLAVTARDRKMAAAVDELFQLFADFEERKTLRRNGDGLARARVATRVRFVWTHREAAEATDFDAFAALERFGHRVEDAIDDQ